ncbi:uncharacterized protein C22orf15 homolog [Oxyura jamaicensis]|uniref:uncharacterized protein C22orf15 homolog n=1 Tax=Oxyura jamaicensis TaxID=8884 RepID=UPI0015A62A67|nr:uncharacterized protein C22orf15 homolog [Oxyura jamaicensis]
MFVTVRYGANCQELVNLQCRVLILTAHLKRKCQCGTEGTERSRAAISWVQTLRGAAEGIRAVVCESQVTPERQGRQTSSPADLSTLSQHSLPREMPLSLYQPGQVEGGTWDLHISSPPDCIDLVDEAGALMNLSKVENPASEFASKYLRERQRYILVRVVREQSTEATCIESLLQNLGKHHPDLADRLQKLSANTPMREQWRKGSLQRRAQPKKSSEPKSTPR